MSVPLRALPRAFVELSELKNDGVPHPFELPAAESTKFRNVLRLRTGDEVAILPGNGSVLRCRLDGKSVVPLERSFPHTESPLRLTVALALSKPDALEDSVRMASEIGVARFLLFPSRRSVVQWDQAKLDKKLNRLRIIAREACEVAFRTKLPMFDLADSLVDVLDRESNALVLSESDQVERPFPSLNDTATLVIGPEGGWDPQESQLIGDRAISLGPRVLRVSTAVAAASALALSRR